MLPRLLCRREAPSSPSSICHRPPTLTSEGSFLGIPVEIRFLIYDYLIGDGAYSISSLQAGKTSKPCARILISSSILQVNKQIYNEAQRILKVTTLRITCRVEDSDVLFPLLVQPLLKWATSIAIVCITEPFLTSVDGTKEKDWPPHPPYFPSFHEIMSSLPRLKKVSITQSWPGGCIAVSQIERYLKTLCQELGLRMMGFDQIDAIIKKDTASYIYEADNKVIETTFFKHHTVSVRMTVASVGHIT